jgi:hypothetical protein
MKLVLSFILALLFGIGCMYLFFFFTKPHIDLPPATNPQIKSRFSLTHAPAATLKGNIISLSGDTKWQSRIATQPAQLTQPIALAQGEEITTGTNGKMEITFPKGITMDLSSNSDVEIIQTLPQSILFAQKSGTIQYTKTESSPLSIRSNNLLIDLQNGTITVTMTGDISTITVSKGTISTAYNNVDTKSIVTSVSSGEQFIYNNTTKTGSLE